MKLIHASLMTALLSASAAQGATIAVIDSGTDVEHTDLKSRIWVNTAEQLNDQDDDANGYVDDINGWNFMQNSNQLINYDEEDSYSADVDKFFEIQGRIVKNKATDEEMEWTRQKVQDQNFVKQLMRFGNYAHGTHVTGISLGKLENSTAIGLKIIGNQPGMSIGDQAEMDKLRAAVADANALAADGEIGPIADKVLRGSLDVLAKNQGKYFEPVGQYVARAHADVANGSFGMSVRQVEAIVRPIVALAVKGGKPTDEQVTTYSKVFVEDMLKHGSSLVTSAPDTLMVFAAGNDGTSNDDLPTFPANIDAPNKISVAATLGNASLASFSNYGAKVDVAAPGVAIRSTIPRDKYISMSGTSQASPYVAHVAAAMKEANSALTPVDMKAIIMGTVDKKDWLQGKVLTSGVVNLSRAVEAAQLSTSMDVKSAIAQAINNVKDQPESSDFMHGQWDAIFAAPLPTWFN